MKRFITLFLAVMMISSMFASFNVFAKNESYTYDDSVVIADFSTKAKIDASGVINPTYKNSFVPSVDYAWGNGDTTLKVPQVGSQSYCMPIPATAVSGKYLRVRYYIPEIDDGQTVKINMLLMAEVHNSNLGSYVCVNFDTTKTGWNEDVFPINSSITAKGFMLAVGGWNDTLATGSTVYLDKISICGKHDYINSDLDDGVFIDNGYIRGPIGTWAGAHNMGAQKATANSRDGSPYVNFTVDANTDSFYFIHHTSSTYGNANLDLSGYKYLMPGYILQVCKMARYLLKQTMAVPIGHLAQWILPVGNFIHLRLPKHKKMGWHCIRSLINEGLQNRENMKNVLFF